MGKASRRKGKENKRPLDPSQMPAPFVARPFEGLAGETDWVAMREIVPSATAKVTFEVDGQEHEAVIATILPMAWPGLRREDGDMMVALQTGGGSGDGFLANDSGTSIPPAGALVIMPLLVIVAARLGSPRTSEAPRVPAVKG